MRRLKPREKRTITIGAIIVFAIFLLWYFFLWENSLSNRWQGLKSRVSARENVLRKISRLGREYLRTQAQIEKVVAQMADQEKGKGVQGFLERLVQEKAPGADLRRMKTKDETVHDLYRQTLVTVKLSKVTLPELVDLLYGVESSRRALKVEKLQIEINRKSPELLDVEFTVVSATAL